MVSLVAEVAEENPLSMDVPLPVAVATTSSGAEVSSPEYSATSTTENEAVIPEYVIVTLSGTPPLIFLAYQAWKREFTPAFTGPPMGTYMLRPSATEEIETVWSFQWEKTNMRLPLVEFWLSKAVEFDAALLSVLVHWTKRPVPATRKGFTVRLAVRVKPR
jgi:hypothetical protein